MGLKVTLVCRSCPRRARAAGVLEFDTELPPPFVWRCVRGHGWKVRALSRDERRAYRRSQGEDAPPFVATPWEGEQ